MGGSAGQIVRSVLDPSGIVGGGKYTLLGATGNEEYSAGGVLYDNPKKARKEARKLEDQQKQEKLNQEAELRNQEKNVRRMREQAGLASAFRSRAGLLKNATRAGTILTTPLGLSTDYSGGPKTLLGQ